MIKSKCKRRREERRSRVRGEEGEEGEERMKQGRRGERRMPVFNLLLPLFPFTHPAILVLGMVPSTFREGLSS